MTGPGYEPAPYVWVPPSAAPAPAWRRVLIGCVVAVLAAGAALVGEFFALFVLTPTCSTGDATPAVLGACVGLTLLAGVLPAGVVGIRQRPLTAVLVGLAAALAPAGYLLHIATTPQSGFCF